MNTIKKQFILLFIAVFVVAGYAFLHSGSTEAAPPVDISYANNVRPILESRCKKCHMGEFVSEGLNLKTYESLMRGSQNAPVIVPGNASDSLIVQKLTAGEMPKRGPRLTPVQIRIITDWINAGALNN
jgi:hypothetical protein